MRVVRANLFPALVVLGALFVTGGGIAVLRGQESASAGWWTSWSSPDSAGVLSSELQTVSTVSLWGAAATVAGLLVLVGTFAYVAGLGRGRRDAGVEPGGLAEGPSVD